MSESGGDSPDLELICRRCKVPTQGGYAQGVLEELECPQCGIRLEGLEAREMFDTLRLRLSRQMVRESPGSFGQGLDVPPDPGGPFIIEAPKSES